MLFHLINIALADPQTIIIDRMVDARPAAQCTLTDTQIKDWNQRLTDVRLKVVNPGQQMAKMQPIIAEIEDATACGKAATTATAGMQRHQVWTHQLAFAQMQYDAGHHDQAWSHIDHLLEALRRERGNGSMLTHYVGQAVEQDLLEQVRTWESSPKASTLTELVADKPMTLELEVKGYDDMMPLMAGYAMWLADLDHREHLIHDGQVKRLSELREQLAALEAKWIPGVGDSHMKQYINLTIELKEREQDLAQQWTSFHDKQG